MNVFRDGQAGFAEHGELFARTFRTSALRHEDRGTEPSVRGDMEHELVAVLWVPEREHGRHVFVVRP